MGQTLDIAKDTIKRTASDIGGGAIAEMALAHKDAEIGEDYHTPMVDKDYATKTAADRGDTNTVKSLVGEHPMYNDVATGGLAHKSSKKAPPKPQPEAHVKKLHTGGYMVTKHHPEGHTTEHGAKNLAEVSGHMEDHMGDPNEGEEAAAGVD